MIWRHHYMQVPKGALGIEALGMEVAQGKHEPELKEPLDLTFTCRENGKTVPTSLLTPDSNHSNSILSRKGLWWDHPSCWSAQPRIAHWRCHLWSTEICYYPAHMGEGKNISCSKSLSKTILAWLSFFPPSLLPFLSSLDSSTFFICAF